MPSNWGPGSGMPEGGILTVTVPGAVWGWDEVQRRFGSLTFKETLQPAIDYAEQGFPISERIAHDWELPKGLADTPSDPRKCCTQVDPDSIATWYIDGKQPLAGQIHRNPGLAKTFRILQQQGRDGFYKGEIAQAIVDKSSRHGGTMTLEDLASYSGEWTTPATTNYHGYDVFTLPPPAQTWAAEEILNILEVCVPKWTPGQTLASLGPANPQYWHLFVEAKKLAFNDLYAFNADPNFSKVPLERLLSKAHAESLCGKVDPNRATATKAGGNAKSDGDTIVLSTADRFGNMVAWVNSLYDGFGSGLTVPGYGITLHDRGGLFTLDPKSPNAIEPHKRPYNTLSAGFVMRNDKPLMTVTLMGGDVQAQGIAQVLVRHSRSRRERAGCIGHGALSSHSGAEHADDGIAAGRARRRAVESDGARGAIDERRADGWIPGDHGGAGHRCLSRRLGSSQRWAGGRVLATVAVQPGLVLPRNRRSCTRARPEESAAAPRRAQVDEVFHPAPCRLRGCA